MAVARSLEEIGHIRWVSDASVTITECWDNFCRQGHVKAYIESLPEECSVKEDLQKSKICFQCLKTKFGLQVFEVQVCRPECAGGAAPG